jgi:SAM-dependent methyltransferase
MSLALAAAVRGTILELAAGTGRICVPLAAAGHDVTGVDRDPYMLERARAAWAARQQVAGGGSLHLVEQDIERLALAERFELVVLALNSLLLMPGRDAQRRVLEAAVAHLAPAGRVVIDVWLPAPADLALYDGRLILDWVRTDEQTGERVSKMTSVRYDPISAVAHVDTFFDVTHDTGLDVTHDTGLDVTHDTGLDTRLDATHGSGSDAGLATGEARRVSRHDEIHFIAADELVALAERAGLLPETVGGDYEMTPFSPGSDRLVMVGRRR